ncbi:hypothetical protein KVR01_002088 [Diaporthe batatas]|uniref:uncharacterized protein n=1 Tax=Diaporthe batatas TaxID=748121 RepID=UPI001D037685|nr:uncharacterized protein KVR01_002088 [Diaporthe batatas]KAG8166399.1 hypothetical protein KVR01_002088 [Diaporthe batatas]
MATASETTVKSIFCDWWTWPVFLGSSIRFQENGTGHLVCGIEAALFIAAEIDWTPIGDCSTVLEQKTDMSTDFQVTLDVEITLTKRAMDNIPPGWVNETNLFDTAFQPRIFKIELAKGRFYSRDWLVCVGKPSKPPRDTEPWHALRLVFDQSPYPSLEHRKEDVDHGIPWRAANGNRWWEFRDFYRDTEESVYRPVIDEKARREKLRKAFKKMGWTIPIAYRNDPIEEEEEDEEPSKSESA